MFHLINMNYVALDALCSCQLVYRRLQYLNPRYPWLLKSEAVCFCLSRCTNNANSTSNTKQQTIKTPFQSASFSYLKSVFIPVSSKHLPAMKIKQTAAYFPMQHYIVYCYSVLSHTRYFH
jgi:hypothetical protein